MPNFLLWSDWIKIRMRHRLFSGKSLLMIVAQKLIDEIKKLIAHEVLVVVIDKTLPRTSVVVAQILVFLAKRKFVLLQITVELVGAQNTHNLHQLVGVGFAMEEWLLLKHNRRKHTAKRPQVKRIVIQAEIHEQLWALEVSRRHTHIILCSWMIVLSQPPINELQNFAVVVDHHIVRFHISVHDAHRVGVVKRFQKLVHVEADVVIRESWVQSAEVDVVDMFKDKSRRFQLRLADRVQQCHNVGATHQVLQDQNFPLDLLPLDRLQNLDHTLVSRG